MAASSDSLAVVHGPSVFELTQALFDAPPRKVSFTLDIFTQRSPKGEVGTVIAIERNRSGRFNIILVTKESRLIISDYNPHTHRGWAMYE